MPVRLQDYTREEIDWAKDCIRTQYNDTLGFLIEMRRTTVKQQADREARDLHYNERYGHAAKEVI